MSTPRQVTPRRARPVFSGPTYTAPRYHSRIWGPVIFFLLVLILGGVLVGGGGTYWELHHAESASSKSVLFQVSNGDSVGSIADRLQHRGLINNALLFKLDARIQGLSAKLRVGAYHLRRNMSIDEMVAALSVYRPVLFSVGVPEGYRAEQIGTILSRKGIDAASFRQEVQHPNIAFLHASILAGLPAGASLEGYLFPDTYDVQPHFSGKDFARLMVQEMDRQITPAMRIQIRREGMTVYQVLTLASIVEREAAVNSERPIIASVYLNRLRSKPPMFLDADPTVQYAAGTPANWWPVLQRTAGTVQPQSKYNTYTHYGLPPGPIANPGIASIHAVVYPSKTTFLYFVAIPRGHGHHAFASTYAQQCQHEQQYGYPSC